MEAYLSDVLNTYLDAVESGLGEGAELLVSSSSGGCANGRSTGRLIAYFSGPAGGVVGSGYSCPIGRIRKIYQPRYGGQVRMFPAILAPLPINPVTAWVMQGWPILPCVSKQLLPGVVPSARDRKWPAQGRAGKCRGKPGPACYGFGGPFCLTDVNLLLSARFIPLFHAGGGKCRPCPLK